MKKLSFRKGTLVVGVPDDVAASATEVKMRACGPEWRLVIEREDDFDTFHAAGAYMAAGPDIHVSGGRVEVQAAEEAQFPEWWFSGKDRPLRPETWDTVRLFGHSAEVVDLADIPF